MAVITSQIARIRVGPNSRNKTTIYTATRVTGPEGTPPKYSTEIIQYTDAKGSGGIVIGAQNSSSKGKIIWNDSASETAQKYQQTIAKASTTQVSSVKNAIAFTAEEKSALNSVSGANNTAIDSGTNSAKPATQTKSEARQAWDPDFGQGQRDDFQSDENIGSSDTDVEDEENKDSGKGTRNSFDSCLVYPTTLRQQKQDTIWFTMMEYIPKQLGPNNGQMAAGDRTRNRKSIGKVVLPIPGGINDSNTTDWASGSMNAGQMALAKVALTGITKGMKAMGSEIQNIVSDVGASKEDVKDGLANALAGAATGDSKALMQRTKGQVINPNMEVLFNGPGMRSFSFAFNMTARSADEGATILKIIRFFKQGMAPIKSASNLFLKSPHTFRLEYKNGSKDHKALNKFKECACTSCALQYTPDGNYATFEDGIMTKYTMTLGFSELEPVFNSDYAEFSKDEIGF